nr:autotransporter outer membrane beta-barrel domain-containing protein [Marinicella sp. W31]MDC2879873.1 autotransporter outer membrane beta-barrel domain-containing protein [Marinicella sp. W31]
MSGATIVTKGDNASGVRSYIYNAAGAGDAKIDFRNGSVTTGDASDPTKGTGSHAVFALARGTGQAHAFVGQQTHPLAIQTYGANAHGIYAQSYDSGGTAYAGLQGGTVKTQGDGSYGLAATAIDGDVETYYSQGTISTVGDAAHGIYASTGASASVDMLVQNRTDDGTLILSTEGDGAHGAYAVSAAGAINLHSTVQNAKTTGQGSHGIAAEIKSAGSTADITVAEDNSNITTQGDNSNGFYLKNYGKGNVTAAFSGETYGAKIATSGQDSYGVYMEASQGGSAIFNGDVASLQTSGDGSHGIYVTNQDTANAGNASITYTSGALSVSGSNSYGLYAEALGTGTADVTLAPSAYNSTIDVSGSGSYGVSAYSQGNITTLSLEEATITATGGAQAAVGFAERAGAGQAATQANIIFGKDLVIDASGSNNQLAFYNADDQAGTNMTLTTTGTVTGTAVMGGGNSTFNLAGGSWTGDIYGDFAPSGTPAANQGVDIFNWSGGTLNSGFYGQGGNDTALISVAESPSFPAAILDGGEDGGAPESAITSDFDQVTFAANNANLAGRNITNWEQFTLNENVAIGFVDDGMALDGYDGGNANDLGDFAMLSGSRVTAGAGLGQSFNLSGNLTNQGTLSMQDGAFGGNFIVGGDYTSKKGRLAIDVDFGALQSDVLTLGGKVDGITDIDIADVGTSGSVGSILVVDMSNSSAVDKNEFIIEDEKNNTTASGIYAYSLEYDLNGDPGAGYAPGLYLTSFANGPIPPGPPAPPTPKVQPYVPLYEGYQSVLLEMNKLTTLRQRVGKRYWAYDAPMAAPVSIKGAPTEPTPYQRSNENTPAVQNLWARMAGSYTHVDPQSVTYDYKYDLSRFGLQSGLDGLFIDNEHGRLISGLTGLYRTGEAKFQSGYGNSKMNIEGWGLGATVTWYGDNGFYADGQAEATWYSSELKAEDLQHGIDNTSAFGYALSMETGKQIGFGNDLIFTPQAQLAWSSTNVESFTGAYSDDVEFNYGNSLTARLGMALERENDWYEQTGLSRHSNIYGIANVFYDFNSSTKATIEQVYVAESKLGGWSGEIGFGGTYDWQDANERDYGVYGEISASMGFESGTYGYAGNVGFRVKW